MRVPFVHFLVPTHRRPTNRSTYTRNTRNFCFVLRTPNGCGCGEVWWQTMRNCSGGNSKYLQFKNIVENREKYKYFISSLRDDCDWRSQCVCVCAGAWDSVLQHYNVVFSRIFLYFDFPHLLLRRLLHSHRPRHLLFFAQTWESRRAQPWNFGDKRQKGANV